MSINLQWVPSLAGSVPLGNMPLGLSYISQIDALSVQQEPRIMQSMLNELLSPI